MFHSTLHSYFGHRNNITLIPQEGIHYTKETLGQMNPRSKANKISQELVFQMPVTSRPFLVFEAGAGIGGLTLALADNPNISGVYVFEADPTSLKILEENIKAYHLEKKVGFLGQLASFQHYEQAKGAVFIIDIPALFEGVRVGGYTLTEWIEQSTMCSLIVLVAPKDFRWYPPRSHELEVITKSLDSSSSLILIKSKRGMEMAKEKGIELFNQLMLKRMEYYSSKEWKQSFAEYLHKLLIKTIPSLDLRKKIIEEENFLIWLQAFTHNSFNRFLNYETLETIGDRSLELYFVLYLTDRNPSITPSQITQLKRAYMSKEEHEKQPEYARQLGMDGYIRYLGLGLSDNILEDVFESFFGALFRTSNNVKPGLGGVTVYNFLASFFDEIGVDYSFATEGSKSQVHIRFSQMHWGQKPVVEEHYDDNGHTIKVKLTPDAIRWFQEKKGLHGDSLSRFIGSADYTLGEGRNKTKALASKEAYDNALLTLNRIGIQNESQEEEKKQALLFNENIRPYLPKLQERLKREGYVDYDFFVPKVKGGNLVELYGIKPGDKKTLLRVNVGENLNDAKLIVIKEYAEGK